jgi:branched-chain amino acid transport system ATP-binding protein
MSSYVLEARGISRDFDGYMAVKNVDLGIRRGEIHALIGPNGAGKTTLFNLLTKFVKPTSGQIWLDGNDVTDVAPARMARLGLVRSFQLSSTFGSMTALENVRGALQTRRITQPFAFWASERLLRDLEAESIGYLQQVGLQDKRNVPARDLSYGSKRALELATTLALEPKVLLLDEPFAGIARGDIASVAKLIQRAAAGRTVLMVEHNLGVIEELSDHVTVLARGEIIAEGTYAVVSKDPAVMEAYLGGTGAIV